MKRTRSKLVTDVTWENRYRLYGITKDQFFEIAARQNNACRLCDEALDFERSHGTHVDHCHHSNVVRGILCHSCNTNLGRFEKVRNWWKEKAREIDDYLANHENIPMQKGSGSRNGKRGRKPVQLSEEGIRQREARKRLQKAEWARNNRAKAKGNS